MRIGIIGAGFTGLAAAYTLQKNGHMVTVFEKESEPGGLAIGYQEKTWDWTLEQHYHHWFTNDDAILQLAREINHTVLIKRPKTSVFVENALYQLDSPLAFLQFPKLPFLDRIRMIIPLGLLRINPFWKPLEKIKAVHVLPKLMGEKAWKLLWEPQLVNKMGKYAQHISLVWFWTRITKRTPSLAYPEGGFLSFAQNLTKVIQKKGGVLYFNTEIQEIQDKKTTTIHFHTEKGEKNYQEFDVIIVTLPSFLFLKIAPQLPLSYKDSLAKLQGLGATNMVLRLKKQFLTDNTYWLSICEQQSPVLVLVEHTNFMDKKHYNNEHLLYIGNYLETKDQRFTMQKEKLLELYNPLLQRIYPEYKKFLIDYQVFRAPFAQPIIPTNYSKFIPSFTTPLPHVYLANMEQVYPWDRGTNYAVALGVKIAEKISQSL